MIDPLKTTLYNHKAGGKDGKPVIPNRVYKELLEALERGETDVYKTVTSEYTLTIEQDLLAQSKLTQQ